MSRKLKLILGKKSGESALVDAQTGEDIDGVIGIQVNLDQANRYEPVATVTLVILDIEARQPKAAPSE